MPFCQSCGSPVDGRFCAKCGAPTGVEPATEVSPPVPPSSEPRWAELSPNIASAICYLPYVGAIIALLFLFVEPFSRNKLIRFHAIQSLLLSAAMYVATRIAISVFEIMGGFWAIYPVIRLAFIAVLIVAGIQAYKNRKLLLPVIGPLAEKWA